jgi:hypothetical protein
MTENDGVKLTPTQEQAFLFLKRAYGVAKLPEGVGIEIRVGVLSEKPLRAPFVVWTALEDAGYIEIVRTPMTEDERRKSPWGRWKSREHFRSLIARPLQ